MPSQQATVRDPWFDNAKMALVTLVVVGHAWTLLPYDTLDDHLYDFLYAWHVPAFVFVTGYLSQRFAYTKARTWQLFCTVVVPYIVFETALGLFRVYVGGEQLEPLRGRLEPHHEERQQPQHAGQVEGVAGPQPGDQADSGVLDQLDLTPLHCPAVARSQPETALHHNDPCVDGVQAASCAQQIEVVGCRRLDESQSPPPLARDLASDGRWRAVKQAAAEGDALPILDQAGGLVE
jgi:hypothetical protein